MFISTGHNRENTLSIQKEKRLVKMLAERKEQEAR
jgi:tRNA(Ile)-lysidine synthase TilS/MesJ